MMSRLYQIAVVVLVGFSTDSILSADWFHSYDYRPASRGESCTVLSSDGGLKIIFMREDGAETVSGVAIGDEVYPGSKVVINVSGRIRRGPASGFIGEEAEDIILDMLVGSRAYVEWSPWPSGGIDERSYDLVYFPMQYAACRERMGLRVPEILKEKAEASVADVRRQLESTFGETTFVISGKRLGFEFTRADGKGVYLDLDLYLSPGSFFESREDWLEQWIGLQQDQAAEELQRRAARPSDSVP